MLPWLIVGGGPHGVHVAVSLLTAGVRPQDLAIVDPHAQLLENWTVCTRRTGMTHLRSPSVHHLDMDPWSLRHFAARWRRPESCQEPLRAPYSRPALPLFQDHSRFVIERYGLHERLERGVVRALRPQADGSLRVETGRSELEAQRVVLALGGDGAQAWPSWSRAVREARSDRIQHVFDPGFTLDYREDFRSVAVVGGGVTGAQLALRLRRLGKRVTVVCRHRLRRQQFDSDPTWLGPAKMRSFARLEDPSQRRRVIDASRHRGSMPAEVHRELRAAIRKREIRSLRSAVRGCIALQRGVVLGLQSGAIEVDAVALATGFAGMPGERLLAGLAVEDGFARAPCGTPLVDRRLHWHANVYCAGALAELELGPVARNIAGARRAGERLATVVSQG
ncbi:MAG: FAD/NAD(P)-binding protein [Nannocystaceae bacterium]